MSETVEHALAPIATTRTTLARARYFDKVKALGVIDEPRKNSGKAYRPRSHWRQHIQASPAASKQNCEENQGFSNGHIANRRKARLAALRSQALSIFRSTGSTNG
jgi:hypothetical protein